MVGDHQTSERVYALLKNDLLCGRRTSDRLNINALAQKYDASATPVREALLRMVGEGLVDMPQSGGFVLPQIDEEMARDGYAFSLTLALLVCPHAHSSQTGDIGSSCLAYPIDALLTALAQGSQNNAVVTAVIRLNDRMTPIRLMEEMRLPGLKAEFDSLLDAILHADIAKCRKTMRKYHQRRQRNIGKILGLSW